MSRVHCPPERTCSSAATAAAEGKPKVQSLGAESVVSDCAARLNDFGAHGGAACVVVQSNRALLVKVPYGRYPGWDLPGGLGNNGYEAACQTAEREV